jgi:Arc/MetJ-type ribon-helix-helix transcriptional regulator
MLGMTTTRTSGQKLLPIPASQEFINALDGAIRQLGYVSRSQFIRDAVCEKLTSMGVPMDRELALAPSRIGKGGRPRKVVPAKKGAAKSRKSTK